MPRPESDSAVFAYLPVPDMVTRLGFYITGAGTDRVPPGADYPRAEHPELYDFTWAEGRVLPEFQFVFIAEGEGEFESREVGRREVGPGTMIVLFPDVWHRYRPLADVGWTEYWISLGGEILFRWQARGLLSPETPLMRIDDCNAMANQYHELVGAVMRHPDRHPPSHSALALSIVAAVLGETEVADQDEPSDTKKNADELLSHRALQVIWNYSHRKISVASIARELCVTRRTLERNFRRELGRTVHEELIACRIERAKRLLRDTHVPIKHVAHAAGFTSLSNMCKVFRRTLQTSPGAYRNRFLREAAEGVLRG